MKRFGLCLAALLAAAPAWAAGLDGSIAGDGYTLRSVQTVETGFGNNQSELNAAWTKVSGGTLWITLTGQVESNFNKLDIFLDVAPGGENVITAGTDNGGANPTNDGWANKFAGFTFPSGFAADYMVITRSGNGNQFDFDFSSVGNTSTLVTAGNIFSGSITGMNANVGGSGIGVGYDNSNAAGVGGSPPAAANAAAAIAVQTGLELAIPLSALGNPDPANIKLLAMINGSNHDYLSNQFLPGLKPVGNLGSDGNGNGGGNVAAINLNNPAYAISAPGAPVVPEPATASLAMLAVAGLAVRRRK